MFKWLRQVLLRGKPADAGPLVPAGRGRGGGGHGGGSERWLITYADMVTLLMVFFIVMYAVSQVNVHKLIELSQSIQKSFRFKASKTGTGMPAGSSTTETEDFQQVSKFVERTAKSAGVSSGITQTLEQRGLTISFSDSLFFAPGTHEMQPAAKALVTKIVKQIVATTENDIRIEGHTDNSPYNKGIYASNWELSALRASSVARFLVQSGAVDPPDRISISGYGEYRPLVPNNTPLNKARNRRVDILLLSSAFGDRLPNIRHLGDLFPVEEDFKPVEITHQMRLENMPLVAPGAADEK